MERFRQKTRLIERFGDEAVIGENSIFGQLAAKGSKVYPDNTGPDRWTEHKEYNGGWTVCYYSGYRKWPEDNFDTFIDSIQAEIGFNHRKEQESITQFSAILSESIYNFYQQYLTKEFKQD